MLVDAIHTRLGAVGDQGIVPGILFAIHNTGSAQTLSNAVCVVSGISIIVISGIGGTW